MSVIGFTVSLLIASLAFTGTVLNEAKLDPHPVRGDPPRPGSPGWSSTVWDGWGTRTRLRALLGTSMTVTDLAVPVDPERDHIAGRRRTR